MQPTICRRHCAVGGSNGEPKDLTNRLIDRATAHGMEVSTEKTKIVTNSANNITEDIGMNGQKLEEVTNYMYLGATLWRDGTCSAEIRIGIASAMAAMTRVQVVQVSVHLHLSL